AFQICTGPFIPKKSAFEVQLVCFGIRRWNFRDRDFLQSREPRLQSVRNGFRNLALDSEDVGKLSIVGLGPKMGIGQRVDQLDIDADIAAVAFYKTLFEPAQRLLLIVQAEVEQGAPVGEHLAVLTYLIEVS